MDSSWATPSCSFSSNSETSSHCIKKLDIKQVAAANLHPRVFGKLLRNRLQHQQHFSKVLESNEMSGWVNMPAFKMNKWIDWNNYENYQHHSDARASQGATAMPEKANGLSINAFLFFAYNNHQSGEVRKWHNIELKIPLGKLLNCLIVLTKETDFYKICTLYVQDIQNRTQQNKNTTELD